MSNVTSTNNVDSLTEQGLKLLYLYSASYKAWADSVATVIGRQPNTGIYDHVKLIDVYLNHFPDVVESCKAAGLIQLSSDLASAINHGQDNRS